MSRGRLNTQMWSSLSVTITGTPCMSQWFGSGLGQVGSTSYTGGCCAYAAGTTERTRKQERQITKANALFHPLRIGMKCSSIFCVLEIRQATARSLVDDTTRCQCTSFTLKFCEVHGTP